MIRSIRQFLLISLLIAITIASSITAVGNYVLDKQVIQPFLDEKLLKFATVLQAINSSTKNDSTTREEISKYLEQEPASLAPHLIFQIWDKDRKIIFISPKNSSNLFLHSPQGFSDKEIQGSDWRVYVSNDKKKQHKIIVAELYEIRNKLADDITRNNAYILLITYPIFGILIWLIVGIALRSITRVTNEISNRASTYLEPVEAKSIPVEIKPLVAELNQLFIRLKLAFERNRRFAADAAHELRTPLAALKTQAQVALKADNQVDRDNSLMKVVQGVDRSSHVVAQLLTLSRLGLEDALNDIKPVDLHKLAAEILAYLVPIALEKHIDIELTPSPPNTIILGNDIALGILIRNIVDNAIRYTPEKGAIKVQVINDDQSVIFRVIDNGPGIPIEMRERVFERFFRILGTTAPGSGLGLAIVSQIAELHNAQVSLTTPASGHGLQFDVAFTRTSLLNFNSD